jgi:acyl-CoA thioesterase
MGADEVARSSSAAMYEGDMASRALGISIEGVGPGRALARMTVTGSMINGHGICHGGYVFLLADTAFAFACNTYGETTVAASAEIVFVASAKEGDELVATAAERTRFGRSGIYDVTVQNPAGETVAEFRGQSRSLGRPIGKDEPPP